MKKEVVIYDQALALKELGFDEDCLMYIDDEEDLINDDTAEWIGAVKAPLKQQVFRWFREKHDLHHEIEFNGDEYLAYVNGLTANIFKTYEEAESACIDKLIEILKNK